MESVVLYVDGGCSVNPGPLYYRGVTPDGEIVFDRKLPWGTNNLSEFLALTTGYAYLYLKNNGEGTVYSDSQTAICWFERKWIKTNMKRDHRTEEVFQKIDTAIEFIKDNPSNIRIEWWNAKEKGEIPADYGLK